MSAPADAVAAALAPYADPAPTDRLLDVPAAIAGRVLNILSADLRMVRLNGSQPPMEWLWPRPRTWMGG